MPVMRRLRHEVVELAEFVRIDVGEAAKLIAPTPGQARVDRRRDAVRIVVRGGDRQVVGGAEVPKPVAVVAAGH